MFKLKDFRIANNLKQSDLQSILDCKQSFISRVENGREAFPANFTQKLIEVYGKEKVIPYCEETKDEQSVSSRQTVPYEFVEALIEERKRQDEERKRHDEMNAELIRQNGELIELLGDNKKTVVQKDDNVGCAAVSGSDLME